MTGSGDNAVPDRKGLPMNVIARSIGSDPEFEALKSLTRLQWMLNFEAVATVSDKVGAVAPNATARPN